MASGQWKGLLAFRMEEGKEVLLSNPEAEGPSQTPGFALALD